MRNRRVFTLLAIVVWICRASEAARLQRAQSAPPDVERDSLGRRSLKLLAITTSPPPGSLPLAPNPPVFTFPPSVKPSPVVPVPVASPPSVLPPPVGKVPASPPPNITSSPATVPVTASPSPTPSPIVTKRPSPKQQASPSPVTSSPAQALPSPPSGTLPLDTSSPPPPPNVIVSVPPKSSSGTSTTTIIAAVAGGVGGALILGVSIAVWCICRKGPKNDVLTIKRSDQATPYGSISYQSQSGPGAHATGEAQRAVVSKEQLASHPLPMHAVPLSLLEPADFPPHGSRMVVSEGPLSAGPPVAAIRAGGAAAAAPEVDEGDYDEALMTWLKGSSGKNPAPPTATPVATLSRRHGSMNDLGAFQIPFESLRMGRRIGEGSFGRVFLASWNETPVAVKVLGDDTDVLDRGGAEPEVMKRLADPVMKKLIEEAGLMSAMRHPNIIQFMGICTMPAAVVTEYCARGSLADVLRTARDGKKGAADSLTWRRRLGMAVDAATGMLYLHARTPPIIHRDLKSPNLLVDTHWRVKVSDFNMSRLMEDAGTSSSLTAMNPRWLAPEVLAGEGATAESDVFSFAVVLWELLTWQLPWPKDNPWSVVNTVGNGGRLAIPTRWELPGSDTAEFTGLEDYIRLMQRCWAHNPYDRPGFGAIIQELRLLEAASPLTVIGHAPGGLGSPHAAGGGLGLGPEAAASGDYLQDDNAYDFNDVTASVSSTAVVASLDPMRSLPNWASGGGNEHSVPQK